MNSSVPDEEALAKEAQAGRVGGVEHGVERRDHAEEEEDDDSDRALLRTAGAAGGGQGPHDSVRAAPCPSRGGMGSPDE